MIVTALVENTKENMKCVSKHGLSLLIESKGHRLIFDLGPRHILKKNAAILGVDLTSIDAAIISHGHSDHGGGLEAFLECNTHAPIFLSENAFDPHYTSLLGLKIKVGLKQTNKSSTRLHFTKDIEYITDDIILFKVEKEGSTIGKNLYKKMDNVYIEDNFDHEISMIIKEDDKYFLFSGCSHKGINNIINKAEELIERSVDYIFAGLHLMSQNKNKVADMAYLNSIVDNMSSRECQLYTFHCTGLKAFDILKSKLGCQINYLATGGKIVI